MTFMPESMQRSIIRRASSRSVLPTAANAPAPPKVMVPMVSVETFSPERPRVRYSIVDPRNYIDDGTSARMSLGVCGKIQTACDLLRKHGSITFADRREDQRSCRLQ